MINDIDDICDFGKVSQRWKAAKPKEKVSNLPEMPLSEKSLNDDTFTSECSSQKVMPTATITKINPWTKEINKENQLPVEDFKKSKIRNHAPQIIDEDTEQFKLRLEHLLNVFKTEATTEFMHMKRSMLDEQKQTIKGETERYLQMYEQKGNELSETKEQLAEKMKECLQLIQKNEKLADSCGSSKTKLKQFKTMLLIFSQLKKYRKQQKDKRIKQKQALKMQRQNVQKFVFKMWTKVNLQLVNEKNNQKTKLKHQQDLEELVAKFTKEQQLLEQRLKDNLVELEEANKLKIGLQENLKRAFMRGVCALNFEAMSVLNGGGGFPLDFDTNSIIENSSQIQGQNFTLSPQQLNNHLADLKKLPQQQQSLQQSTVQQQLPVIQQQLTQPQPSVQIYNQGRVDINENKWKDAPLIGVTKPQNQPPQKSVNEPLPPQKVVEPTISFRRPNQVDQNSDPMPIQQLVQQNDDFLDQSIEEGKVIRVQVDNKPEKPKQQQQQQLAQKSKNPTQKGKK